MRYFLTHRGESSGPHDATKIKSWVFGGQVGDDATVREEFSQEWVPVRQSAIFAKQKSFDVGLPLWIMLGVLAVGFLAIALTSRKPKPAPPPVAAADPAPAPNLSMKCTIAIPGKPNAQVPVFPTEEGLEEFGAAAVTGDEDAVDVAVSSNGGFMVPSGTKCLLLDGGFTQKRVRVLSGPHTGKAGWLPIEWTQRER